MIKKPASTHPPVTLESIVQQRNELKEQICQQKELMNSLGRELFAPLAPATNKAGAAMRAFNTGMAVFDGVMLGIKIMRRVRKLLR